MKNCLSSQRFDGAYFVGCMVALKWDLDWKKQHGYDIMRKTAKGGSQMILQNDRLTVKINALGGELHSIRGADGT